MNKQQLLEEFKIGMKTVRSTLKACGLSLEKEDYNEEEVEKFREARKLITEQNKSYSDVSRHFGVPIDESNNSQNQEDSELENSPLYQVVDKYTRTHVDAVTTLAVQKAYEYFPEMLMNNFRKIAESGLGEQIINSYAEQQMKNITDRAGELSQKYKKNSGGLPGADYSEYEEDETFEDSSE